jgi:hypothetical protein
MTTRELLQSILIDLLRLETIVMRSHLQAMEEVNKERSL